MNGRWWVVLAACVAQLISAAPAVAAVHEGALVRTDLGWVKGAQGNDHRVFQGIPYAAAPTGNRRWRSPAPARPWPGVRNAIKPGPRCVQRATPGQPTGTSEDCLYLNVTVPRSPGGRKPVMVWLHGGGFIEGAGSDFDAHRLATTGNVIVVTVNYRLGVFGLFAHPGLAGSGGFALEDQQAALRWVRRNAVAFGGDPGNITLFGESAGGKSVCAHLASPRAAGLFQRAIMQSAPCTGTVPAGTMFPGVPAFRQWPSVADRQADGARLAAGLGCADPATALACLRRLPTERLLPLHDQFITPAVGSPVLPRDPERALAAGMFHRVPVISGATRDEMRYMVALFYELPGTPITGRTYARLLRRAFGEQADRVARRYPLAQYASPGLAWATLTTDVVFACPTYERNRSLAQRVRTYAFEFAGDDVMTEIPGSDFPLGSAHGAELAYLFPTPGLDDRRRQLSTTMIEYWTAFARTGDPNAPGLPRWRTFDPARPSTQSLAVPPDPTGPTDLAAAHRCAFWAGQFG
ncbi:carboxylesterase/lipase family protein [Nonomuraea jiangxiensis]|uniref:Carboxylic ester hydrolase n=1 Tax=Nonomuraea jiangxiensis TaxID=633440 RepID=A0A1G8PVP0_9ACTN|nr:carboxylesterase family protein [Nonomuraea jiangxiensis]SDI96532.1 para-nitrobenzyl esterase [Nonomuraea jiangxiensis]